MIDIPETYPLRGLQAVAVIDAVMDMNVICGKGEARLMTPGWGLGFFRIMRHRQSGDRGPLHGRRVAEMIFQQQTL